MENVLKRSLVGRIGCHADGETYIVPISYAFDGRFIYCHTHNGKKTDIMRKNARICFQVDDMKNMANWESVLIQGHYEEIVDRKERNEAMQILLSRYLPVISSITTHLGEHWPFQPDDINEIDGVVFRIAINEMTGRYESSSQSPSIPG